MLWFMHILHDDLPDRNDSIHDRHRNEPVYQCTGIRDNWYVFCSNRCSCQSDPGSIIHFVLGFGIKGAAIATVLSQFLSAAYVLLFLEKSGNESSSFEKNRAEKLQRECKNIVSLGTAGFIMQLTNSLVTICCNNVLGGYRRGCLHICYDNCIKCPSARRDADLCYK